MSAEEAIQSFNDVHTYIHQSLMKPQTHFFQADTECPVVCAVCSVIVGLKYVVDMTVREK